MKRIALLLVSITLAVCAVAQTQQGIVRTIERPGQKSVGINGVTIKINEYPNAIVSGKGGKFSFTLQRKKQGDRCQVTSVIKKGYTLIDKMPSFAYSFSTPAEIVMVSNKQLQQDEKKIRDKAQKEAEANYHKRIAELERQLQEKTISEEKYREQLQHVFDGYENYLKMIDEMARRYAMTDYKGISELNRQIQECIENAELERADSLINSKGDLNQRKQELQNKKETTQKIEELHKQALEDYLISRNDLAQDYYTKYYICTSRYDNDSAAYWLRERADLDSSNVFWQVDAARFIEFFIGDFPLSLDYYERGLLQAENQYGHIDAHIARLYDDIGGVYDSLEDYDNALHYRNISVEISEQLMGKNNPISAITYSNIGLTYFNYGDTAKALQYYQKALDIYDKLGDDAEASALYNNIGLVYFYMDDFEQAFFYYLKALIMHENEYGSEHYETAKNYNNVGAALIKLGKDEQGLAYITKALNIREKIFGENHPYTASSYNNLGGFYDTRGDYEKARELYFKAIAALGPKDSHSAYPYYNIATTYYKQGKYEKAIGCFSKSVEILESINPNHPLAQRIKDNIEVVKATMEQPTNN